ncbi:hypothetical protein DMENIID0001_010710 [Sergentomyia squamirostris]
MDKRRNFWGYLKPIYILTKCLLVHPVTIEWKSGIPRIDKVGLIHSLGVAVSYYIYHLMMARKQIDFLETDYNFVTHAIDSYNLFAGCTILLLIVLTSVSTQKYIVDVLTAIYDFDDAMDKLHLSVDNRKWSLEFYLPGFILFTALSTMEYENCIMFIRDSTTFTDFCLIMCYVPMFVLIVTEWMFIGYIMAITYRFRLINDYLKSLEDVNCDVVEIFKAHAQSLLKTAKKLNSAYSFPLLLLLLNQFTAMATLLYDLCMSALDFTDNLLEDIFKTGGWSMLFMVETMALCYVCQRLEMEAEQTGRHLVKLSMYGCLQSLQLVTRSQVKITACHLLHVNLKLFYSMFGAIVTYLIILVQFDIAQDQREIVLKSHHEM